MKSSRSLPWSELRTGLVIILALILLSIGVIQLGGRSGLFTRNYTLYVRMGNTLGLKAGNIVGLAGVDVGNVEDIKFPANTADKKLVVVLRVKRQYMDRIREDSVASVRTMGLLGDRYIDISVGSPASPVLPPGSYLKAAAETEMAGVLSGATSGLAGLNVVLGQLKVILGGISQGEGTAGLLIKDRQLYDQLTSSAANLDAVVQDLRKARGSMGKFIENPELYDNLVGVSAKAKELVDRLNNGSIVRLSEDKAFYNNLVDVSANLRDVSSSSKALVANLEKGNLAKLSSDKELYGKVQDISTRLDAVISRLESGQGSAGKLLSDEKLYNNMNKFFEDADALVLDINKNPKKYVRISIF
jgi:phospholipid/cholesterol/gamma-HCH transport system substrate-binding protein